MLTISNIREKKPDKNCSIELTSFTYLDIETTGLRPDRGGRIIEIAMLNRNRERFLWEQGEDNISDGNLAAQLPDVLNHLTTGVIVGHNVNFDLRFIAYETERLGFRGPNVLFIDTLRLAKKLCDNTIDYQLYSLLDTFDISTEGPIHTAIVDAKATRALFWKLINFGNIETLTQAGLQRLNWSTF